MAWLEHSRDLRHWSSKGKLKKGVLCWKWYYVKKKNIKYSPNGKNEHIICLKWCKIQLIWCQKVYCTLPQSFQGRRWAERTLHYLLAKWWVRSCLDASISTQMHNSYPKDTLTLILTCFPHCYCTVHPLWPRNVLHMLADKWMRHFTEKDSQQPLNNLAGIGYFVTVWIVPWLVREQTWHLIS